MDGQRRKERGMERGIRKERGMERERWRKERRERGMRKRDMEIGRASCRERV